MWKLSEKEKVFKKGSWKDYILANWSFLHYVPPLDFDNCQMEHHVPRSFYLIFVRKKVLIATSKEGNYIEMLDGRKLASDFSS